MTPDTHVLVIGAGLSGTAVGANLARESRKLSAILLDRAELGDFGPAYRTTCPLHLLNTRAQGMSLFPAEPDHFVRWAAARGEPAAPAFFARRSVYRAYLQAIFEEASKTGRIRRAQGNAVRLTLREGGWLCELEGGRRLSAAAVVLAFGVGSPAKLAAAAEIETHPAFVGDIWRSGDQAFPFGAKQIGLIGSGLTAIDVVLAGEAQGLRSHYTLVSRHGLVPQVHAAVNPPAEGSPPPGRSIRTLMRTVRAAAKQAADWRSVLDDMRPRLTEYWDALSVADQARFLRHVRPYWESHRHRMPPEVGDTLARLVKDGRLVVRQEHIERIESDGGRLRMCFADGNEAAFDAVINCTGLSGAPNWQSRLIDDLVKDGLARYDVHGLGLEADCDGRIVGPDQALYAVGFLRRGQLYESTAARELGIQAGQVARSLAAVLT